MLFFFAPWITPYFGTHLCNCYGGPVPGRKAVGASSWPLPSNANIHRCYSIPTFITIHISFWNFAWLSAGTPVPCIILGPIGPIAIGSLFPGVKRSERQADSFHLMRTFIDVTLSLPLTIHISFWNFAWLSAGATVPCIQLYSIAVVS